MGPRPRGWGVWGWEGGGVGGGVGIRVVLKGSAKRSGASLNVCSAENGLEDSARSAGPHGVSQLPHTPEHRKQLLSFTSENPHSRPPWRESSESQLAQFGYSPDVSQNCPSSWGPPGYAPQVSCCAQCGRQRAKGRGVRNLTMPPSRVCPWV